MTDNTERRYTVKTGTPVATPPINRGLPPRGGFPRGGIPNRGLVSQPNLTQHQQRTLLAKQNQRNPNQPPIRGQMRRGMNSPRGAMPPQRGGAGGQSPIRNKPQIPLGHHQVAVRTASSPTQVTPQHPNPNQARSPVMAKRKIQMPSNSSGSVPNRTQIESPNKSMSVPASPPNKPTSPLAVSPNKPPVVMVKRVISNNKTPSKPPPPIPNDKPEHLTLTPSISSKKPSTPPPIPSEKPEIPEKPELPEKPSIPAKPLTLKKELSNLSSTNVVVNKPPVPEKPESLMTKSEIDNKGIIELSWPMDKSPFEKPDDPSLIVFEQKDDNEITEDSKIKAATIEKLIEKSTSCTAGKKKKIEKFQF